MPVRSLGSSLVKWPDAEEVDRAVRAWAAEARGHHPEMLRLAYVGSYARGDWGVGSDVDLVMIVATSAASFLERASGFDLTRLPVPADLVIYTSAEWQSLLEQNARFARMAESEGVWISPSPPVPGQGGSS